MKNYQDMLEQIVREINSHESEGVVASYLPELARVDPDKFGVHLTTLDGKNYALGDSREKFSLQSIAKVLSLTLAVKLLGEDIFQRVGVEPSGNPFNSLVQLEYESGIPRNPLINSGALVIADILVSRLTNPRDDFIHFIRKISGIQSIDYNQEVAQSEKRHGFRNAALINLMKAFGNIENDIDVVLDFYFHECSVEMTCEELAQTFTLYANHGKSMHDGETIISVSQSKRINAIMQTCGFYDEAG
ncbi:MAG: glutaminase A, partial [candidate division KSB1 bacterium]|nr:glutaminase A [candidate division KSB1 bacterium]